MFRANSIDHAERRSPLRSLKVIAVSCAALTLTGAISYNLLVRHHGAGNASAGNAIEIEPDRIGKLAEVIATSPDLPLGSATHVRVEPEATGSAGYSPVVYEIQRQLAALGYYNGPRDGRLNARLRSAVAAYQRRRGLAASGVSSRALLEDLRYHRAVAAVAADADAAGSTAIDPRIIVVQKGLAELGYAPGPVDGTLGERTRQALMQFQRDRELPVTGKVTQEVLDALDKTAGVRLPR